MPPTLLPKRKPATKAQNVIISTLGRGERAKVPATAAAVKTPISEARTDLGTTYIIASLTVIMGQIILIYLPKNTSLIKEKNKK